MNIKFYISRIQIVIVLIISMSCNQQVDKKEIKKQLFDHNWTFKIGDYPEAKLPDYKDAEWRKLDIPHDWSIEGKLDQENPMGGAGGYFPAGVAWYRKSFEVPSDYKGRKISIYFEGVYMNAEVYINGHSLGVHPYGYTSFAHDLTPYIQYNDKNIIAVKVDNSQQINCRWYSGSGIYRHVWLQVTNPVHLEEWETLVTTPEVSLEKAIVKVKTLVRNQTESAQTVSVLTSVMNSINVETGKAEKEITVPSNEEIEIEEILQISTPALWSPETPNLYKAKIDIVQEGQSIDHLTIPFGVRSIQFDAEKGFVLNDQPILLNGGCVHHDNGALGAAAYDRAEERKVELLKEAGFNTVRVSHNPPSEAFLDACDRLGLLVIDESFDGWKTEKTPHDYADYFNQWWEKDIEAMVKRDRNHPSIVMWSIGNEIIERTSPDAVVTARMLADAVHKLDATRPVTSAMTTWGEGWDIFDPLMAEHDICGYNYQLHMAEGDHERVPDRVILQTESYPKDAFYCWDMVQKHPYVIGDIVWTAMDYLGESGIGRYYYPGEPDGEHWMVDLYPWHGAYCGDIDLTGWRKPISHYRNILWNDKEKLYMGVKEPNPSEGEIKTTMWAVWPTWESWTWPGMEGKKLQVEVYSKYPKVRLYLNGEVMGEKSTTIAEEFKANFEVEYVAGELKVVGVENREEVDSSILVTAGETAHIKLTADRDLIHANGQDLSFITIELTDEKGILNPNADDEIEFSIDGPGQIVAVENANLRDLDSYVEPSRRAWNGRAMVVVKSEKEEGDIVLKASVKGLPEAEITIKSE